MNALEVEKAFATLKVDSAGRIRGKNAAINKIHSDHFKAVDKALMDIRVFVARMSTGQSSTEVLKAVDEFIYQMQIKP